MRLFTQLDPDTYEDIEDLVNQGSYDSVDQFLRVAAQNQLAIERADEETGQLPSEDEQREEWGYTPPVAVPTGHPPKGREDLLLFSQYYRFFPLKCALYLLGELVEQRDEWVTVDEAREYVGDSILPIRDRIVEWEEKNEVKKQDKKSTALPKRDSKNPERSRRRYLNHYLGRVQPEKERVAGFGFDMGYVAFQDDGDEFTVTLTERGVEFLELTNPLLDQGPDAPVLSETEREFILDTIRDDLPSEYRFMQYVYEVIAKSEGSYTDYLSEFREFLEDSPSVADDMSDNNVRSHVGGAISRMVELDILQRGRRRGWYATKAEPSEW